MALLFDFLLLAGCMIGLALSVGAMLLIGFGWK